MRGGPQYLNLQQIAKITGRPLHELLQMHVLESFVERLSRSVHHDSFVLKGGVLLPAYLSRRPTRDVDLQSLSLSHEIDEVAYRLRDVATFALDDGTILSSDFLDVRVIRDDEVYSGLRFKVDARVATARIRFHIDISFGDPIFPRPQVIELPRLIGNSIRILGYPLEMVLAEKIVTAVQRSTFNTRWRDFVDVLVITRRHVIDGSRTIDSVNRVADFRRVRRQPLESLLSGIGATAEPRWSQWREKQRLAEFVPESFDVVVREFIHFAGPVVVGSAAGQRWSPLSREWEPDEGSSAQD